MTLGVRILLCCAISMMAGMVCAAVALIALVVLGAGPNKVVIVWAWLVGLVCGAVSGWKR